ncbi:hypothetical protein SEUCBS139899_000928 [Sporothrix eucalyptigena]|uniref:Uncharacterized protein n=1 Tax=Sporothrix eucalyptigena TaxID=1812306 RepID=A0ABP0BJ79_9PEZI
MVDSTQNNDKKATHYSGSVNYSDDHKNTDYKAPNDGGAGNGNAPAGDTVKSEDEKPRVNMLRDWFECFDCKSLTMSENLFAKYQACSG